MMSDGSRSAWQPDAQDVARGVSPASSVSLGVFLSDRRAWTSALSGEVRSR